MGTTPPSERSGISQAVPPLAGHKSGVVGNALAGHAAANFNVGKNTFPGGLAMRGSKTTSGSPSRYVLGIPD